MRYIDMVRLLRERDDWPPPGWEERMRKAQAELRSCPPDKKERPLLLDPTHPEDPGLITFRSDGRPRPKARDKTSIEYQRAEVSINAYHLNHNTLNRKRKTQIYYPLCELVEKIQKHKLIQNDECSNITLQNTIEDNLRLLHRMIAQDAEYSSAARAYLKRYRHWDWVDQLLTAP